jgi:hypothetical protein
VDLDFEPRWVTKDEINGVRIWDYKPDRNEHGWLIDRVSRVVDYPYLKLAEFDGKDWTECIYEVPRKTTGKIKKLECYELADKEFNPTGKFEPMCFMTLIQTINSLVDAVNELKGAKNE